MPVLVSCLCLLFTPFGPDYLVRVRQRYGQPCVRVSISVEYRSLVTLGEDTPAPVAL